MFAIQGAAKKGSSFERYYKLKKVRCRRKFLIRGAAEKFLSMITYSGNRKTKLELKVQNLTTVTLIISAVFDY